MAKLKSTGGDAGSPAADESPAAPNELRNPAGASNAPAARLSSAEVHEALRGVEDTLKQNIRASTGFLSLVGAESILLPERVLPALQNGVYRAEEGNWVMRVENGRVVHAAQRGVSHAFADDENVTVIAARDDDPPQETDDERVARELAEQEEQRKAEAAKAEAAKAAAAGAGAT